MLDLIRNTVQGSIEQVRVLGDEGKDNVEVGEKRTCLAEKVVSEYFEAIFRAEFSCDYELMVEGFPTVGNPCARIKIGADPMDGTAYYVRTKSASPIPVTVALAVWDGPCYDDILVGAVGNIYSGEIWSASGEQPTRSNIMGRCQVGGNEAHDPVMAADFYFRENAQARMQMQHPVNPDWPNFECLNLGSVAEMLAKVACGELDAVVNLGGPSTYEMVAGFPLIRRAGGCVISARDGTDLGTHPIEIKNRVPMIAAKDEDLAQKIYSQVSGNSQRYSGGLPHLCEDGTTLVRW